MSAMSPSSDLAPKSAKYIQLGVLAIIVIGLVWWLKPIPYYPTTSQALVGTWAMYDSGYDATGIIEIHQDGSYITRYEHTGPRDFQMKDLGMAGTWHLDGRNLTFDDPKKHDVHVFNATMTEDKKKMKLLQEDEKFYYDFTRR